MGLKKLESGTLRNLGQVRIWPMDGYHMVRMQPGEYLVINNENPQNNVIVDADTVLGLFMDLAEGLVVDEFRRGHGTMWRVEREYE